MLNYNSNATIEDLNLGHLTDVGGGCVANSDALEIMKIDREKLALPGNVFKFA